MGTLETIETDVHWTELYQFYISLSRSLPMSPYLKTKFKMSWRLHYGSAVTAWQPWQALSTPRTMAFISYQAQSKQKPGSTNTNADSFCRINSKDSMILQQDKAVQFKWSFF